MPKKVDNYDSIWIIGVLILAMVTNRASGISCVDAVAKLSPCLPFLLGSSNSVTVPCCEGASTLNQLAAANPGEKKGLCQCFKQAAASAGVNLANAKQLPQLCSISVPVPIDPHVNCDSLA